MLLVGQKIGEGGDLQGDVRRSGQLERGNLLALHRHEGRSRELLRERFLDVRHRSLFGLFLGHRIGRRARDACLGVGSRRLRGRGGELKLECRLD